jgi:hypothetical protein
LGWLVATPLGALTLGLKGAALAVPVNFLVQLSAAIVLSRRARPRALDRHADTATANA